jgi:hypothetical protein
VPAPDPPPKFEVRELTADEVVPGDGLAILAHHLRKWDREKQQKRE